MQIPENDCHDIRLADSGRHDARWPNEADTPNDKDSGSPSFDGNVSCIKYAAL
jgi:hypothetical protein